MVVSDALWRALPMIYLLISVSGILKRRRAPVFQAKRYERISPRVKGEQILAERSVRREGGVADCDVRFRLLESVGATRHGIISRRQKFSFLHWLI